MEEIARALFIDCCRQTGDHSSPHLSAIAFFSLLSFPSGYLSYSSHFIHSPLPLSPFLGAFRENRAARRDSAQRGAPGKVNKSWPLARRSLTTVLISDCFSAVADDLFQAS